MKVLVLGGSHFVGRAVVVEALAAGHEVETVNRGHSGRDVQGAGHRRADRTDVEALRAALGDDGWDAVIDTWSGAPIHATNAARLLAGRAGHYGYVSSRSVYAPPVEAGADESAPVVDADPDDTDDTDYARAKRGAEIGVLLAHPDAVVARAGLVLGPYENVGRLPAWLARIARGGRVLAPGPRDRPLQYVDARDLASWMLRLAERSSGGVFNVVSRRGHATMGELLDAAVTVVGEARAGSPAELVWLDPAEIEQADIEPWTELPIWLPPDGPAEFLHDGDVSSALASGLTTRSVLETVRDTWRWMQDEGAPEPASARPRHGLDPEREAEVLARFRP